MMTAVNSTQSKENPMLRFVQSRASREPPPETQDDDVRRRPKEI